jgi:hypothetical protein
VLGASGHNSPTASTLPRAGAVSLAGGNHTHAGARQRTNEGSPGAVGVEDGHGGGMAMQFTRVVGPVEDMEIWNASSAGFSFVISCESRSGPGFHGPPGYVASWRLLSQNTAASESAARPLKRLLRPKKPARPCWDT